MCELGEGEEKGGTKDGRREGERDGKREGGRERALGSEDTRFKVTCEPEKRKYATQKAAINQDKGTQEIQWPPSLPLHKRGATRSA